MTAEPQQLGESVRPGGAEEGEHLPENGLCVVLAMGLGFTRGGFDPPGDSGL